jgi:hypothetical protein
MEQGACAGYVRKTKRVAPASQWSHPKPSPTQQLYEDWRVTPIVPILQYHFGVSSKPNGDSMSSMSTMDGPDFVNFEVRVFRGHRLELEERLRLSDDGKLLRYSQQIGGPDGKTNHYELEFNLSEGNSPVNNR